MSETRELLAKISALRQRLEQAQGLVDEARSAAAALAAGDGAVVPSFPQAVQSAGDHDLAMDAALRPVVGEMVQQRPPSQFSSRARRVLERGRDLLGQLRAVADRFPADAPLAPLYQDTVAMIDTALRTVGLLPESMATQMHLCKGLEVTLEEVATRLRTLLARCEKQENEDRQIEQLSAFLAAVSAGAVVDLGLVHSLADEVLYEAQICEPLRFLDDDPNNVPRFIASHCLTVARVLARVVRHESDLRSRPHEMILSGLLHDIGMLGMPGEMLAQPEPWSIEQKRVVEAHTIVGAQQVSALFPDAPWLADAVGSHHERLDGTGYPDGLKDNRIRPLGRLLAVCDVYAAMCCRRSHRPARATRTALADTLLLAEQGQLDRGHAECLLRLSFYPVGSVVELAHGAIGVVVATPTTREDLNSPARPVVALLTDSQGQPLARPQHLDLAEADTHSIVRPLNVEERLELLGRRFPQWAA
jgi:HD-GYP domain-containing protein (c-di-GMP phosphodiesterase class II)